MFSRHNHGGKPRGYNLGVILLINSGKYFISYGQILPPAPYEIEACCLPHSEAARGGAARVVSGLSKDYQNLLL